MFRTILVLILASGAAYSGTGTATHTVSIALSPLEKFYPGARELLILADGGGSNGSRTKLWKVALQELSDKTGIAVSVCHFPPGISKWNKIEHRMFCHITENWRGEPLVSHEVIMNLIGNTTATTGLEIQAELDRQTYPTGIKIADADLAELMVEKLEFHGEWNCGINRRLNFGPENNPIGGGKLSVGVSWLATPHSLRFVLRM